MATSVNDPINLADNENIHYGRRIRDLVNFVLRPNFHYHANEETLNDIIKLSNPENPTMGLIAYSCRVMANFVLKQVISITMASEVGWGKFE